MILYRRTNAGMPSSVATNVEWPLMEEQLEIRKSASVNFAITQFQYTRDHTPGFVATNVEKAASTRFALIDYHSPGNTNSELGKL